ncbi:MAG: hypothetical protein RR201_02200 [Malacoplasma sp.]
MEELLKIIYFDYYNIKKTNNFHTDKEFFRFLYNLKNYKDKKINSKEILKKYVDPVVKEIRDNIGKSTLNDDYFIEKNFVHLTYPFEQTMKRLQIIYISLGEKEWNEIFSFKYRFFIDFICFIIRRVLLFNDYALEKDKKRKKEYKESFAESTNFYFTKAEFYDFFPKYKQEIDKIFNIITINIFDLKKETDVFKIIESDNKYILYFLWDFIYFLYDSIENEVIKYYSNNCKGIDKYYSRRGKALEKYCYINLINAFPKTNIRKNLCYGSKNGNNEIDIILETENEFIIFEQKSSKFDIHQTKDDKNLKEAFIKAFGNSFKTLNNFYEFAKNGNDIMYFKHNKKKVKLDLKLKKIILIQVSLHNIEYMQSSIQKFDKNLIKPVTNYPICWNFIDFLTILELVKMNTETVMEYINKRYDILNRNKKITLDIDEIDAMGFLTDSRYEKQYEMLTNNKNNNVDLRFMIRNGAYRNEINELMNSRFYDILFNIE